MSIRVAFLDNYEGAEDSLIMSIIKRIHFTVEIVELKKADLVLRGPFRRPSAKSITCRLMNKKNKVLKKIFPSEVKNNIILVEIGENIRYNAIKNDYCISSDLGVESDRHFRMPHWMLSLDWSAQGFPVPTPHPRIRRRAMPEEMTRPLGRETMKRPNNVALFTTHLNEPRATLWHATQEVIPNAKGFGPYFDKNINNHNNSPFKKDDILNRFKYNLCPENSLYPGYYTEKVVEAYAAGCIPITWADPHISVDFNPEAIINMHDFASTGYAAGLREALSDDNIRKLTQLPLMNEAPTIEPLVAFLERVVADVLS